MAPTRLDPGLVAEICFDIRKMNRDAIWQFIQKSGMSVGELKRITHYVPRKDIKWWARRKNLPDDHVFTGRHDVASTRAAIEALTRVGRPDLARRMCDALGKVGGDALAKCLPDTQRAVSGS